MGDGPPVRWAFGAPAERLAWRRYWIRDTARGVSALVLHRLFRLLPVAAGSAIGGAIALAIAPMDFPLVMSARANIVRLRPDLAGQAEAMTTRLWENIGRVLAEVTSTSRLWKSARIAVRGIEHLHAVQSTGRPRIFITVHTGDWELLSPILIREGEVVRHIYQPQPNRFRRRIASEGRSAFPGVLVEPNPAGVREVVRHLSQRRGAVVIFVDEIAGGVVQAPALGRPLSLSGNLAMAVRLALLTRALVVPAAMARTRGCNFELLLGAAVELEGDSRQPSDLRRGVERLDPLVEALVLDRLDQWVMLPKLKLTS